MLKLKRTEMKITDIQGLIVISIFYVGMGVANFVILYLSKFLLVYMGILGVLSVMAAAGLLTSKRWGFYLANALALLEGVVAVATLHASFMLAGGFSPNVNILALNVGLICWTIALNVAVLYLFKQRRRFS